VPGPHHPYLGKNKTGETIMFKGLGQMGDMAKMMKAAQEMQTKMSGLQEEMRNIIVTGESGAGLVKATATAKGELKSLDIDPSIFNTDDKEVVEDLILAAIKDAQSKADERAKEEMSKITQGMGLPKDMDLPF
jgi:DNA-binding YbaB/EbfC family protein